MGMENTCPFVPCPPNNARLFPNNPALFSNKERLLNYLNHHSKKTFFFIEINLIIVWIYRIFFVNL